MAQLNLLPDVKLDYIQAARIKRVVVVASLAVIGLTAVIVTAVTVSVVVFQKNHLDNLNNDVKDYTEQLTEIPDIEKILTVQNQLNSLPGLHEQKPMASRMFVYVGQLTPSDVTLSRLHVNFEQKTIDISGEAPAISNVNQFADTLKFTDYTIEGESGEPKRAFSNVVLANFSRQADRTSYQITLSYDPMVFDVTKNTQLVVPNITTTRSAIERPEELFQGEND